MVPNQFGPPGQTVPIKFGPPGQMVPQNLVPLDKCPQPIWSPYFRMPTACPPGQTGPFVQGDQIGWGPFVHGDRIFGDHLSMGTELVGDRLSTGTNQLGTNCGGPNVWRPYVFGTNCVTAEYYVGPNTIPAQILISRSRNNLPLEGLL